MTLNMKPGLIPYPVIEDDIIDVTKRIQSASCRGYDHLKPDRPLIPEFLVLHKQQSPPDSTLGHPNGYFTQTCCPALTDLEINSVTGRMRRFVERGPGHDIAGWANGRLDGAYGDAAKYIEWKRTQPGGFWANLINIEGEALEISGWFPAYPVTQDTPVEEAAIANICQWMAARAHDYGISWETFPIIPGQNNRSYITWHQEWTIGTGKTCPGPWVMNQTSAWIERARQIMKAYQTADVDAGETPKPPKPPVYAAAELPEWWSRVLEQRWPSDAMVDGVRWFAVRRRVEALRNANRYSQPDTSAPHSGPKILAGEKIAIERWFRDQHRKTWLVEDAGHFVPANAFTPAISLRSRA